MHQPFPTPQFFLSYFYIIHSSIFYFLDQTQFPSTFPSIRFQCHMNFSQSLHFDLNNLLWSLLPTLFPTLCITFLYYLEALLSFLSIYLPLPLNSPSFVFQCFLYFIYSLPFSSLNVHSLLYLWSLPISRAFPMLPLKAFDSYTNLHSPLHPFSFGIQVSVLLTYISLLHSLSFPLPTSFSSASCKDFRFLYQPPFSSTFTFIRYSMLSVLQPLLAPQFS